VTFEKGCHLSRLEDSTFLGCSSLSSICIPSSVDIIGQKCFDSCASLSRVTFEDDSKLSRIERDAFRDCFSLTSICLPATVQSVASGAFPCETRPEIAVQPANPFLKRLGLALVELVMCH
jgi:hypothetical protein